MVNGHGGARPGAGRKPKAEKYASEIEAAERAVADKLPAIRKAQEDLALGGLKRITRKRQPAGLIFIKEVQIDGMGNPRTVEVPAFPDEDPKKLIVVEETTETLAPDRAAGQYLIDRILGKPTQAVELSGPDGGDIPIAPDLRRLSDAELAALGALVEKATPDRPTPDRLTIDDGDSNT